MQSMYYISSIPQGNSDHEVHVPTCPFFPKTEHRKYIGTFNTCHEAVKAARSIYPRADGCKSCLPACHTR